MITRIWHGRTSAAKSDEYLNLMRTVAIPDYRSVPGNKGAYALRRIEGDTAHFLMLTFWESEDAVRAFEQGILLRIGSTDTTSTAAPASLPSASARARSESTTSGPRAVLIRNAVGFVSSRLAPLTRPAVWGVSGQ